MALPLGAAKLDHTNFGLFGLRHPSAAAMDLTTAYRYNQNMMEYYTCKCCSGPGRRGEAQREGRRKEGSKREGMQGAVIERQIFKVAQEASTVHDTLTMTYLARQFRAA